MIDLKKLEDLAKEATAGPWTLHRQPGQKYTPTLTGASHYNEDYVAVSAHGINPDTENKEDFVICDNAQYYAASVSDSDAAYIAAANPAVILELIETQRDLVEAVHAMYDVAKEGTYWSMSSQASVELALKAIQKATAGQHLHKVLALNNQPPAVAGKP